MRRSTVIYGNVQIFFNFNCSELLVEDGLMWADFWSQSYFVKSDHIGLEDHVLEWQLHRPQKQKLHVKILSRPMLFLIVRQS